MVDENHVMEQDPDNTEHVPAKLNDLDRMNPRLVFTDPNSFFGREFYRDLLMEQQEQF